jgi:hypothetical protein
MASTLSSSSSLTPADSASSAGTFKTPAPVNPDVRRFKSKTYRRVYLERLKKPRTGWWWAYGCEWDEEPQNDQDPVKYYWVCGVCENFHAIGTTSTTHIREHLAKIHRIIDPSKASEPSMPILLRAATGIGHLMMEALLILLPKTEGQPRIYRRNRNVIDRSSVPHLLPHLLPHILPYILPHILPHL